MITAINNNLPATSCAQTNCEQQSVQNNSIRTQHPPAIEDQVRISEQAREHLKSLEENNPAIKSEKNLGVEDKREVEKLKKRDQEVKAHERAHMAAGSGVVMGGASYEYEHGPDGKMYAVGGEVKIDTSKENDPEATIRKMQKVREAALAPAQPSATDRSVAAKASQIEAEARIEMQEQKSKATEKDKSHSQVSPNSIVTNPFNAACTPPQIGDNISVVV